MARITARMANTRSRTKFLRQKKEKLDAKREALKRHERLLANIIAPGSESNITDNGAAANNIPGKRQKSMASNATATGKINRGRWLKRASLDNRKITDYFSVHIRGREDPLLIKPSTNTDSTSTPTPLPTAPAFLNSLVTSSTQRLWENEKSVEPPEIECITICSDDDDDAENDQDKGKPRGSSKQKHVAKQKLKIEYYDGCDSNTSSSRPTSSLGLSSSFKDLNIKSVQVDTDVQIVEVLPPIPLRDHEVFDLEEEQS